MNKVAATLFAFALLVFVNPVLLYAQITGFTISPSSTTLNKTSGSGATSDITITISCGASPVSNVNVQLSNDDGVFAALPFAIGSTTSGLVSTMASIPASVNTPFIVNIPNATANLLSYSAGHSGYKFRIVYWDGTGGAQYNASSATLPASGNGFLLQELPTITITAAALLPGGVTGTIFCEGTQVIFGATAGTFQKTAGGNFGASNTFYLDISDKSGVFGTNWYQGSSFGIGSSVSSSPNTIYGSIPSTLVSAITPGYTTAANFGTGHKFRIRSSNPVAYSNVISSYTIISIPTPPAAPANQWMAYVYNDRITPYIVFDKYAGYFNAGSSLTLNSTSYYSASGSPSSAIGFSGCSVGTDYHSVRYQRTGFTCGYYKFDINVDNNCKLYIDGALVYTKTTSGAASDVWRCFLGASSKVTLEVSDKTSNSQGILTLTALSTGNSLNAIPSPTICSSGTGAATLTASVVSGANIGIGAMTYSWSPATGLSSTTGATVTASPASTTTYTVTATNTATGCTDQTTVTVNVQASLNTVISPPSASICPGASIVLTATGAANYSWSPAIGLNTTTGAVVTASPVAPQTYTVTGSATGCTNSVATVSISVGGVLTPTFGNGVWNVYCYSNNGSAAANGFATILGSYTENNLSFDTRTRWGTGASPSSANASSGAAYTGCPVPVDYHSYTYMRKNFTCGIYQFTVTFNDDYTTIFVDGVQVFSRYYSTTSVQTWRGFLGPNSTVEVRTVEFAGGSGTTLNIDPVNAITMASPTVCINTPTTLSATLTPNGPDTQANTTYTWTATAPATTAMLSSTSGSTVTFNANPTAGNYTFTCTISNNKVGTPDMTCSVSSNITVNVINTAAPPGSITPVNPSICGGGNVTLTATGGITYRWYYLDSTKIKDGTYTGITNTNFTSFPNNQVWKLAGVAASYLTPVTGTVANLSSLSINNGVVVANPLISTHYGVEVSVGGSCASSYATVDVIVGTASNPSNFNQNVWFAYVYEGNNFNNYYGYYTVTDVNFSTTSRWGVSSNPSLATGNNPATLGATTTTPGVKYVGCPLPSSDNFSISFKRQGFPCGFYKISFPTHDDEVNLKIGAGDPATGVTTTALTTVTGFPRSYTGSGFFNVWQGFLGPNSQIEATIREFGGSANLSINFQDITASVASTIITSSPVTVCKGATVSLNASVTANKPNTLVYTWEAFVTGTSTPYSLIQFYDSTNATATNIGRKVIARVGGTAVDGDVIDIKCTVTDPISGTCSMFQTYTGLITVGSVATTILTQDKTTVCSGEVVNFTASGANFYTWSLDPSSVGTDGTFRFPNATGTVNPSTQYPASGTYASTTTDNYGGVMVYTPGASTSYKIKVIGSTGPACSAFAATANVSIVNVITPDPGYGNGVWNVVCYNGTSPVISSYASGSIGSNVRGMYREEELSFNTQSRWDKALAPSAITVNTPATCPSPYASCGFSGCAVDNDNHTIIYKRTGIDCNIYRIDLGDYSNATQLDIIINGVTVYTSPGASQKFNAWNGSLSPNDKIEIRYYATTGNSFFNVNFAVIPPPASSVIWTGGGGNSEWRNLNNWCSGLPEKVTDVFIPYLVSGNYPVINDFKAITVPNECRNLNIASGANLTINPNIELSVYGNFTNNGSFSPSASSVVRFRGLDSVNIGGASSSTFGRLQFDKGGQMVTLTQNISVNTSLDLTNVQLIPGNNSITINTPNKDSLLRSNGSFILSETNAAYNPSIVCWNMSGGTAGTKYEFPFGTSFTNYLPVYFTKNTAQNYTICTSTRATSASNKPYAQNQAATWTATVGDASLMIDRWWDITSSVNPLSGAGANIELSYGAENNTLPGITTSISVFHYDPANGAWDPGYAQTSVPVTNGVGTAKANNVTKFSPHLVGDVTAALPVSLIDFSARILNKQVTLEWQTASELNNDYFMVERSTDALQFEAVMKVKSKQQNSNQLIYYNATDDKPYYGISYYRLKQTDVDGLSSYSRVISVEIGAALDLVLAPNPTTSDNIKIWIMGETHTDVKFSMKDIDGKPIYSEIISIGDSGKEEINISKAGSLSVGVYICSIQIGNKTISKKLVVQ